MKNSRKVFDVMVIGAGPSGALAAKTAADKGFFTCLLEKEQLGHNGRYKACGGAIDWKLVEEIHYPEEKISRVLDSIEIHHMDGEHYSKKGKGAVVWRSRFDKFLIDMAVSSGAILKEKAPLINIEKVNDNYWITTPKQRFITKYVIAADGVTSRTLKLLKWPPIGKNNLIVTLTQEMRQSKEKIGQVLGANTIHLFFGIKKLIPIGYAWLFPKTNIISVGWGNQLTLIKKAREEYQKFLDLPLVTQVLNQSKLMKFKAHLIPVGLRSKLYGDNVFAVGDAGGIVDPISGKGIPYAMLSGQMAIETIATCENSGTVDRLNSIYEKKLDKKILNVLKAKRLARDRIFQNDEILKRFLAFWEKYRSSEIVERGLI
jgi:geranylgeranyl reductase family protein